MQASQLLVLLAFAASVVVASPSQQETPSVPFAPNPPESSVDHSVSQVQPQPQVVSAPVVPEHQPVSVYQPVVGYQPGVVMYASQPGVQGVPVQNQPGAEQFGQAEPGQLPANYKPFGSWGLYIGGNPQDGYYSNYYKALGASAGVDKPQQPQAGDSSVRSSLVASGVGVASVKPLGGQVDSPFPGSDFYPFSYSAGELGHAAGHAPQQQHGGPVHYASPAVVGSQIYGLPNSVEHFAKPDHYVGGTKRAGAVKEPQREFASASKSTQQQQQVSGTKSYSAGPVVPYSYSAASGVPVVGGPVVGQPLAYPVPVGSQIVGSQYGLDGAFSPYGVHAFTKYAYKPSQADQVYGQAAQYPYAAPSYAYQPQPVGYPQQQQFVKPQVSAYPSYASYPSWGSYPSQQYQYQPVAPQPIVGGPVAAASAPASVSVVENKPVAPVVSAPVDSVAAPVQPAAVEVAKPEAEPVKPAHH